MGILVLGAIIVGLLYMLIFNFKAFLGVIGGLLGLGILWLVGMGALVGIFSLLG
jgi:hypothetical protein